MVQILFLCAALVTAQAAQLPGPDGTDKAAAQAAQGDQTAKALAKYNGMREKTPQTAAAQWKLGVWCEENGLAAEAQAHFSNVVKIDPKREAAWRKLGYTKVEGRWMTDEQVAEEKEAKKADALWAPGLKKIHKDIHGGGGVKRQDEARDALDAVTDPAAVASVYREFAGGGELDQKIMVQVLGQIDKPISSKALAVVAVYGKTPEVRRYATEILRRRNQGDFLDVLVGLMADPLTFEVKAVGGPGSPGILFVEGERFNVRRFYAAPTPPNITPRPGDTIAYDNFGTPSIIRRFGIPHQKSGVPGTKNLVYDTSAVIQYSEGLGILDAQRAAASSQAQLQADVAQIESINEDRGRFNDLVIAVMKDVTGKDRGRTPKKWRDVLALEMKYAKAPAAKPKATIDEMAPMNYTPLFGQLMFTTRIIIDS